MPGDGVESRRGGTAFYCATANREMSCLHHLISCGVRWEMIEISPFSKGPSLLLKENNERLRFLSEDEIDRLLDVCPPYLNHIVTFLHSQRG